MTYFVVNSGPLTGVPIIESGRLGPPRAAGGGHGMFTQWGPNGVFGRGAGRRQLGGFGLGSAVLAEPPFFSQFTAAQAALQALAGVAQTVRLATTDPAIEAMATTALKFAANTGPALVAQAKANNDVVKLASIQASTQRILAAMKPEVVPAALSRFFLMAFTGPTGAFISADTVDAAREDGRAFIDNIVLPGLKKTTSITDVVMVVGGLFAVGYLLRAFTGK